MNILVVQETDWLENLPLQSHHIMEALSRRGHRITVIDFPARSAPGNFGESIHSRVFSAVQRTDPQSSVRLIRPGLINALGVARISSALTNFKLIFEHTLRWCDVIVLYSVPTNGLQTILSSRLASKPIVFHAFDVLHRMTGHDILRFPTWTLERLVYRRAERVVVISSSLMDYMKALGIPERRILLLPPAVDTNRFSPEVSGRKFRDSIGISSQDLVLLFSGWLYDFSGLDILMVGMTSLLLEIPSLKLVICGDGPLLTKLTSIREKLSLQDQIKILGKRPYNHMPEIAGAADVCINPYKPDIRSDYAFPSKIAEYMASGKPVVASDLPGTRAMLGESSGVILAREDALIPRIKELLLNRERRIEFGKMARKYCEDNFSIERVVVRFESLLTEAVSSQSRVAV